MSKDRYNRFAWRDAVFADTDVTASVKCLAYGIAEYINHETGEANVGTRKLAEACGNSQTWVTKTIPLLAATGWLQVLRKGRRGSGEGCAGLYKMNRKKEHPVCSHKEHPVCSHQDDHKAAPREYFWLSREHTGYSEPLNHKSAPPARSSEYVETEEDDDISGGDEKIPLYTKDELRARAVARSRRV